MAIIGRLLLLVVLVSIAGFLPGCAGPGTAEQSLPEAPAEDVSNEDADKTADKADQPQPVPAPDAPLEPEWEREPLETIQIRIDGVYLETDVPPEIIEGRTMVPMRALFEAMGAEVEWDDTTLTVEAIRGEQSVYLTIDSREALVDGRRVNLDAPARLINGRTFVPLRFVSEALGFKMSWDLRVIDITSST